jgi:hypothetical protein
LVRIAILAGRRLPERGKTGIFDRQCPFLTGPG